MARGLSREQSKEKNLKKAATASKGNKEDLSSGQRAERDAKMMQEKQAAKAAAKAALAASGADGAAQVAAEEAKKAAQREAAKERRVNSTQVAKQNIKAGVTAAPVRDVNQVVVGESASSGGGGASKPKLTPEEKKKKAAAAAALAAAGGAPAKKKKKDDEEEEADGEQAAPSTAEAGTSKVDELTDAMASLAEGDEGEEHAADADEAAGNAKDEAEEMDVAPLDPEAAARVAARAKETAAKIAGLEKEKQKKQTEAAHQKVRDDISSGKVKGISVADWDLLSSVSLAVDA